MAWWKEAFAAAYSTIYAHRSDEAAADEVAGVLPRLQAAPGPVLDACCGAGRHLAALRRAGVAVHGFDWSHDLLAEAHAQRDACIGKVVRADVRHPPFTGGWGAITLFLPLLAISMTR